MPMNAPLDHRTVAAEARALSDGERLLHMIHSVGGLIATTTMHVRGPLTEDLMRGALDWLQQRHGILRAHIAWRGFAFSGTFPYVNRNLVFETRGTAPIKLTMVRGDWQARLQKEIRTPIFSRRGPRLRVTVVSESAELHHIILVCDHSIGDAQAAFAAMRDILTYLADPGAAPRANDTRLPPALESGRTKASDPAHVYEPAIRLPVRRVPGMPLETRYERRVLDPEATAALRAAVREHKVTLNSAVSAAVLAAAGRQYGMPRLTCLTNAEFRRLMKPPLPNETFGCYIDVIRTTHDLTQPFWTLARDVARRLITAVTRHPHQVSVLKLWNLDGYRYEAIPTVASGYCLDGVAVTTGGETGLGRGYGDFELEDITLCTSLNPVGIGLYVAAVEFRGTLQLTFCYGARRLEGSDIAAIADATLATLSDPPAD